jgi:type IV secretory pathway VirB10-like protein
MTMASIAHLKPEERFGLGVAVAAHVALFAALLWHASREPATIPPADRMSVSLAEEVSLESTAPDPSAASQAAIAPIIAPTSAPAPVPTSEPVRRPVERTIERPTPRPSPTAARRPEPRETSRQAGGSRLGDDFLRGTSDGDRADSGSPAATFGAAEAASLAQAISRQLKPHWSAPQGPDVELLVTRVRFRLNSDGSLAGAPVVVSQSGETPTNRAQKARHAEQAVRAVRLAAPFDLPEEFYDQWKTITTNFDRRL